MVLVVGSSVVVTDSSVSPLPVMGVTVGIALSVSPVSVISPPSEVLAEPLSPSTGVGAGSDVVFVTPSSLTGVGVAHTAEPESSVVVTQSVLSESGTVLVAAEAGAELVAAPHKYSSVQLYAPSLYVQ